MGLGDMFGGLGDMFGGLGEKLGGFGEIRESSEEQPTGITIACGCNQGLKRKNNEDNFYFDGKYMQSDNHGLDEILTARKELDEDGLFVVFDGMGGMDYGEVASYTAAKVTKEFLAVEENMNPCDITPSLMELCQRLNTSVYQAGADRGSDRVGSTLVGVYFHAGQMWLCNLGDSPAYLIRDGKMMLISKEHTDAWYVKEQGLNRKPWLTQYLGVDPQAMRIEPYIKSRYIKSGDCYLVCSDGVTDMVSEQEICNILTGEKDPARCVQKLIEAALAGGGVDNITAIVCKVR